MTRVVKSPAKLEPAPIRPSTRRLAPSVAPASAPATAPPAAFAPTSFQETLLRSPPLPISCFPRSQPPSTTAADAAQTGDHIEIANGQTFRRANSCRRFHRSLYITVFNAASIDGNAAHHVKAANQQTPSR